MELVRLIISIVVCLAIGFSSSYFTKEAINSWYKKLKKPSFNPPNWIFAPVWTILYILMGIAAYYLWGSIAIIPFIIQLVLNFFWSYIFFFKKKVFTAFIEIIFLWIAILVTIILSWNTLAAYLLIPYLLWVSFATLLNYKIYELN